MYLPGAFIGEYKLQEHIHRHIADWRLLAIPTSWGRVADLNPNWETIWWDYLRLAASPIVSPIVSCVRPRASKGHADLASSSPSSQLSQAVSCDTWNAGQGLRMLPHLRVHLKAHADDNHAAPVPPSLWEVPRFCGISTECQALVRFFVCCRIKPHDPPLVWSPVYSFEF